MFSSVCYATRWHYHGMTKLKMQKKGSVGVATHTRHKSIRAKFGELVLGICCSVPNLATIGKGVVVQEFPEIFKIVHICMVIAIEYTDNGRTVVVRCHGSPLVCQIWTLTGRGAQEPPEIVNFAHCCISSGF